MTLNEFKIWLEGFNEAINEAPTAKQWELILNKIKLIQAPAGSPATKVAFDIQRQMVNASGVGMPRTIKPDDSAMAINTVIPIAPIGQPK